MPTPPMIGPSSGTDTQKTIQQLIQLEREPIRRMEADTSRDNMLIQGWDEVLKKSRILADRSRVLYSFAGPFSTKRVLSSEPGVISGEAAPRVENLDQEMQVLALATNEQIQTGPLQNEENLPAAKFQLGTSEGLKAYEFAGGNVAALQRMLTTKASGDFDVSLVRADDKTSYLVLRSQKSGKVGAFKFADENGFLKKIGLVKPGGVQDKEISSALPAGAIMREPTRENSGSAEVGANRTSIRLSGKEGARIWKNLSAKSVVNLDVEGKSETTTSGKKEAASETITVGPDVKVDVAGVKLHGYNVDRTRERPGGETAAETVTAVFGVGIVWEKNGKQEIKEIKWEGGSRHESIEIAGITGGAPAVGVYLFTDSATANFSGLNVIERTPGAGLEAASVTVPGQDAKLRMNGVEITRPTNTKLTDIIDGVSLNLNKTTAGPIHVIVQANADDIVLKIKEWTTAYNDLMKFCRTNSKVEKRAFDWDTTGGNKDLQDGLRQVQVSAGIFATDPNIRQLTTGLRSNTGSAYPSGTNPSYKVLADVGVSTGEVGKDWEEVQAGYLVVDEDKLRRVLGTAPGSVKELFASDNNDDNVPDNGVAFAVTKFLEPYNRPTGGVVVTRINLLKSQVADRKEGIRKKEISVKASEESLRRRFGRMESVIRQSKAVGDQMRNGLHMGQEGK